MKVNREELLYQLESVQSGLSTREIIEQSSCFVFRDGVVLTYNDEIACHQKCVLDITGAIKAAPMLALLRKLVEDEIDITVSGGEMLITGKRRKAGLSMESEIMLPIEKVEQPESWKELPADFGEAVSMIQKCAGKDESAFVLTCVHVHPKWLEACDNFQMSRYTIKTGVAAPFLVKRDALKYVTELGMTEVGETTNWVHFRNPSGLILSCRRFVEEYPNITPFLETKGEPTVLPKGLGEAAEKAAIFASESSDDSQVLVELRPGKLRIKGKGASGWFQESKKASYNGKPMSFLIQPSLLGEVTKQHNSCEIAEGCLKVDGGRFVYVTSLGVPSEED